MERLDLAIACCKKSNLTIDWGYSFIDDAVKDGVVEQTYSGITVHITLRPEYR